MSQDDSQESQDSTMTVMQEDRHEVLYFAYGSNLSTEQMRQRCPSSTPVGLAYLRGWRWFINGRGYANVAQLGDSDDEVEGKGKGKGKGKAKEEREEGVYGLLYLLPPQDEERLDGYEGVPWAYQKFQVDVKWARKNSSDEEEEEEDAYEDEDEEPLRALIYVDGERVEEGPPREEYVDRMEKGIEDGVENWGLDEEYADKVMRKFWRDEY